MNTYTYTIRIYNKNVNAAGRQDRRGLALPIKHKPPTYVILQLLTTSLSLSLSFRLLYLSASLSLSLSTKNGE
jgi:hypothetical protein